MKKALSVVLSVLIMLSFTGCLGAEKGEIGKTYTSSNDIQFTVNQVEITDVIDGWGGANDDFWKPLDENNCNVGGRYTLEEYKATYGLTAKNDDERIVFISYTVKNVSGNDKIINDVGVLKFDNGDEYSEGVLAYRVSAEGVWKELPSGVSLDKSNENEYEFRAYIVVPKEVAEADETLTYTLFGYKFEIR